MPLLNLDASSPQKLKLSTEVHAVCHYFRKYQLRSRCLRGGVGAVVSTDLILHPVYPYPTVGYLSTPHARGCRARLRPRGLLACGTDASAHCWDALLLLAACCSRRYIETKDHHRRHKAGRASWVVRYEPTFLNPISERFLSPSFPPRAQENHPGR